MSFGSAIALGIGFMIGIAIFIIGTIILIKLFSNKKGDFTVEMFEEYKESILSEERYEEANKVDIIIKSLNDKTPNKKLLSNYEVKSTSELIISENNSDGTSNSMKVRTKSKIISKHKKNRNKK